MLFAICLWWIGLKLAAPTWYFVILGSVVFINTCTLLTKIYKLGKKAAKNEE